MTKGYGKPHIYLRHGLWIIKLNGKGYVMPSDWRQLTQTRH